MSTTSREPWLDNAKIWLVTIVVIGHALILMPSGELNSRAYDFIYYFHIPAFVLITGYLSRKVTWSRRHLLAIVTGLLVPYVIFEALMALYRVHVTGDVASMDVLWPLWINPHWPMWYLIVLAMWRLATPILKAHWLMIPVSIAISLVAGRWDLETLDLNRALGLLPFFTIGLYLGPRVLGVLKNRWSGLVGLAVLWGVWQLAAHTDDHWSTQWLYYRTPYADLDASFTGGAETRAWLLGIGLLASLAVLSLVPVKKHWFSAMGAYTMGVYLLHGFVIRGLEWQGYTDWMPADEWLSLLITVAVAITISLVLAWPPLARRLIWLVDPIGTWRTHRARTASAAS